MPRTGLAPEVLREKAVAAAEEALRRAGPDGLRLTEVARSLGVSHAALYRHFADKESLLDAISSRWLDGVDRELESVARGPGSPGSRIVAWFAALHRLKRAKVEGDPALYAAFEASAGKLRPFIEAHLAAARGQLEALADEAMRAGEIRRGDPRRAAQILFEATLAFHHPRLIQESLGRDRIPALKTVLKTLLAGMR